MKKMKNNGKKRFENSLNKIIKDLDKFNIQFEDIDLTENNFKKIILGLDNSFINLNFEIIKFTNNLNLDFNNDELNNLFKNEKEDLLNSLRDLRKLIFEDLILNENDINKLISIRKNILDLIGIIKRHTIILFNMSKDFKNFKFDLNLNSFKKLNFKDLKPGDVVLTYKENKLVNKYFLYKVIKKETHSNFIHSFLYYGFKNGKYLFVDTDFDIRNNLNFNSKFKILNFHLKKGEIGFVLRLKNGGLKKNEIKNFHQIINSEVIGKKYGFIKAINLAISYELFRDFKSFFRLKNNLEKDKYYCSEMIVEVYEKLGYQLSPKNLNSTISPVDVLNISELEVIGVLKPTGE